MRWLIGLLLLLLIGVPSSSATAAPDGQGITIAILDSGIDSAHAELSGRVSRVSFWEPNIPVGLPLTPPLSNDPTGQGTAVASVAAGRTLGLAHQARLLDLQVSAQYTNGVVDPVVEDAAIRALDYLLQEPGRAQVVVLSFAQNGLSTSGGATIAGQADALWRAGVLVVVPTSAEPSALASLPSVLTVAGSENCPTESTSPNIKPDLVAPSQDVMAAKAAEIPPGASQEAVSGTAYAAARVAGAVAILRSEFPGLPIDVVASFLRDSADDLGTPGPDRCSGFGALNPEAAVTWAALWRDPASIAPARESPVAALVLLAPLVAALLRRR